MTLRSLVGPAVLVTLASCSHLPGHGGGGGVNPDSCGGYASTDVGAKLKAFLQATKDLDSATGEIAVSLKSACTTFGNELGMDPGQLKGDDTGAICNNVFAAYKNNLKVGLKAGAKLTIQYTPAQCTADASASASASGGCSGQAAAGNGGAEASGQCAASAQVEASVHVNCTPPQLNISADAGMVVDDAKMKTTIKAAMDALPQMLTVSAKIAPIQAAFTTWAATAKDLASQGTQFAQNFKDQALCIGGQISAAAGASAHIQANVNVSVSVSASASGSVAGG
jgi:hypothetical protein